jgi:hypothetical protein
MVKANGIKTTPEWNNTDSSIIGQVLVFEGNFQRLFDEHLRKNSISTL